MGPIQLYKHLQTETLPCIRSEREGVKEPGESLSLRGAQPDIPDGRGQKPESAGGFWKIRMSLQLNK